MSTTTKKPFFALPNEAPTRTQERISNAVNQIVAHPIIHGIFLDDVELVTGQTYIEHGLNERVRYWMIVDQNYPAFVYRGTNDASHPESRFILLQASHAITVSLYLVVASPSKSTFNTEEIQLQM